MVYNFYGYAQAGVVKAANRIYKGIETPIDLYNKLSRVWCADTCAPRMRDGWRPENMTLGQCSITAFLAQDLLFMLLQVVRLLRPDGLRDMVM